MASEWRYGDAWEQYPMEPGQVWTVSPGNSQVAVHDIFEPLPSFMHRADLLFVDPPWNNGNLKSFYTKAGRSDYRQFDEFTAVLFRRIEQINPIVCYIEIGNQFVEEWYERLGNLYPHRQRWPVLYYRKHPTNIIRGSRIGTIDYDFTGIDEARCIELIAGMEGVCLGDLCMGRGLVGIAAFRAGKSFVGTELNKRRLANLLQRIAALGGTVCGPACRT